MVKHPPSKYFDVKKLVGERGGGSIFQICRAFS
ncbi:hypothetical protein DJ91_720 [Priestia megaterium]|uniref:Uncharacterized protein n=1 Tax=Priestia megaterium (strain ATCC 14581 / DSM 32 / CCUG 1817 / JCM 2506 / NBRC 15308 / NCIMB 9376 / NCTC 10342 / NRRL B-14308 / VKM B-512 / Ford 19) TaxID=1348623 RepID=A0A0B6AVW4_PRIM2|nr:hypothetical protein BG04_4549 [Priestia megaterium NBRC 15308 = ATCC 14581]KFM97641.1 hypothetical protein DJ91_720 [Priestia megaterium]